MRAVLCEQWGGPEALVIAQVASRALGPQEVRVGVRAAGVNHTDVLIIQGTYQLRPPLPFTPGAEAAGVVLEVGAGVTTLAPRARVACLSTTGAFAQELIVPASACFALPESVSFETGAVLPASYGTAWHALRDRGALQEGERVLVLGASGGVGLAAVQVAKALGAFVIAAASTRPKLEVCRAHGADALIDISQEELRTAVQRHTGAQGLDVVVDVVGGALSEPALRSLARRGRHLVIGFAAGGIPAIPWNLPLLKGASIVGVYWGDCVRHQSDRAHAQMVELMAAVAQGQLRPIVSERHPLEDVGKALVRMRARELVGKCVIVM